MKVRYKKIKSKYSIQNVFEYVPFHRTIKIIKYNKKLISSLDYLVKDIKNYLFFNKVIKPISNCEDYLPILKRILSSKNSYINIINTFCNYLNKNNNEFIPQINRIKDNEHILNKLNSFKIGYNNQFLDYFFNEDEELDFKKLSEFCLKYGEKIKEITLMDSPDDINNSPFIYNFVYKYIIINSNIQKIEDYFSDYFDFKMNLTEFIYLFDLEYDDNISYDYKNDELIENIDQKKMNDKIKQLKSYSIYFEDNNNYFITQGINSLCLFLINYGKNIENLEITKIEKDNKLFFIDLIQNLNNLKTLIITLNSGKKLYNCIATKIKKDSLYKLEINLNNFLEGYNIINKNKKSLLELTLKIKYLRKDNNKILKTLSDIINLKKLKLICDFHILDEDNIKYFSLKNIEYLEIPLYINLFIFDFNIFFEKLPKLKKLKFNGINFIDNEDVVEENINRINNFQLDFNLVKNLKKINFINCKKHSSFFIIKLIEILSKSKIRENIKEIKIKNCDFDKKITFNNLIILISSFKNIKTLSLNNISFEASEAINYDEINNFEKLEKLYFKGLNYEKNEIKILFFLYKFSQKCKRLNELGFSCKGLNPYDMNLIFKIIKNYKLLIKLNIFDDYTKEDYYTNEEDGFYLSGINIGEIIDYCMFDLKSIKFKKENKPTDFDSYTDYDKNTINKYLSKKNNEYKRISNKKEKYHIYENIFNNNSYLNKLFYSGKEKSFIIGNINHFNKNELEQKYKK